MPLERLKINALPAVTSDPGRRISVEAPGRGGSDLRSIARQYEVDALSALQSAREMGDPSSSFAFSAMARRCFDRARAYNVAAGVLS